MHPSNREEPGQVRFSGDIEGVQYCEKEKALPSYLSSMPPNKKEVKVCISYRCDIRSSKLQVPWPWLRGRVERELLA